jgi:hypothetical protein
MATQILDHTRDLSGTEQHRLVQLYPPPEFVKEASHEALHGNPEELPPHVYAMLTERMFPCHTKAATWMSALFFQDQRRKMNPSIAEGAELRLTKSAAFWNIQPAVTALWEKMAEDEANGFAQLSDEDFALVWAGEGQPKERHYPIRNAGEVKMASEWFGNYHGDFNFSDKNKIATKILAKADEFGAPVSNSEQLHKCAGFGYCSNTDAAAAWEKRSTLTQRSSPEHAEEAARMGQALLDNTFEARDQGKRIKMAELMDQFDRQTHLDQLYDAGGLERPEEALFVVTEKAASQFLTEHAQTTTGAIYEKQALERLTVEDVRGWMGDALADEVATGGVYLDVEKLAEVLPTLPRDDAAMFEKMTSSLSIPVAAREKAAAMEGLSLDEMHELSKEYGMATTAPDAAIV